MNLKMLKSLKNTNHSMGRKKTINELRNVKNMAEWISRAFYPTVDLDVLPPKIWLKGEVPVDYEAGKKILETIVLPEIISSTRKDAQREVLEKIVKIIPYTVHYKQGTIVPDKQFTGLFRGDIETLIDTLKQELEK